MKIVWLEDNEYDLLTQLLHSMPTSEQDTAQWANTWRALDEVLDNSPTHPHEATITVAGFYPGSTTHLQPDPHPDPPTTPQATQA